MALFLPFQNRKNALLTVETVAERNSPIFAKQALSFISPSRFFSFPFTNPTGDVTR